MPSADKSNISILLVDDEPLILRGLARRLRGYRLHLAYDVPSALEILRDHDVDIVISDYNMPGPDGLTLMELVRRKQPRARRVLMSATPPFELTQLLMVGLIHHYLPKPFGETMVQQILATADSSPQRRSRRRGPSIEVEAHERN